MTSFYHIILHSARHATVLRHTFLPLLVFAGAVQSEAAVLISRQLLKSRYLSCMEEMGSSHCHTHTDRDDRSCVHTVHSAVHSAVHTVSHSQCHCLNTEDKTRTRVMCVQHNCGHQLTNGNVCH